MADLLRHRLESLGMWWRASLTVRVVSLVMAAGVVAMLAAGTVIVSQVRSQLFEREVTTAVDLFEASRSNAQTTFDAMGSPTVGEIQDEANAIVQAQYDPIRAVMGAAMMRAPDQSESALPILEPYTQSSVAIRDLISPELRTAIPNSEGIHWQSVALPNSSGGTSPGIVVGAPLNVQGAGTYEYYVAYSFEQQEGTVRLVTGILTAGAVVLVFLLALIAWLVVGMVLRPVQEASRNAQRLADGAFDARMVVRGDDELAHLAESFNQMAESISDQVGRLERMSAVQQEFVSAVSHELRSPVTTIRMAGQLIYDKRADLPPALRRSAELQHGQLINLDTMLSDLLEISRFDAGAMVLATEQADLAKLVHTVVESQEPLAESNGVAVHIRSEGDVTASVEPRRVERIIRNLVVNALEHAECRPVLIRIVGGNNAVSVEVSDHGVGLTDEQASHVFDRFWRADTSRVRKSGGTGLGLTIAREDAMLHGGRLQCSGTLGVGSTFLLTLPREPRMKIVSPVALRVAAEQEDWDKLDDPELDDGHVAQAEDAEGAGIEAAELEAPEGGETERGKNGSRPEEDDHA
ncbi:MAG: MtrAB system histidine kinase MtrB [Ancrocorticia sp.]|uniref:MtrAB system histidine kinase MtrB n=1 Tax=Ancrocorticia sp. TaxID=2593684 RepID=UPI003F933B6A